MTDSNRATDRPRLENLASGADVLIVGASARAAAHSAIRAGLAPISIDRFGDVDLCRVCPTLVADSYPGQLLSDFAPGSDALPWIYTGALENHPELIERLAATRPLWGNDADVVGRVRDPWQLHAALSGDDIATPAVRALIDASPRGDHWLVKSPHSSGGSGVSDWPVSGTNAIRSSAPDRAAFLQQHIDGEPVSAVFVAAGGCSRLLGISTQLIGTDWAGADGYRYVGSLASNDTAPQVTAQFARIGETLAASFRLTGLFGVDAIESDSVVWPIEVNPRYTASVEVIERLTGVAAIDMHVRACRDGVLPAIDPFMSNTPCCAGKAILFARRDVMVTESLIERTTALNSGANWPTVADIPRPGTPIPRGAPILTVLAQSTNATNTQEKLQSTAGELESLLS